MSIVETHAGESAFGIAYLASLTRGAASGGLPDAQDRFISQHESIIDKLTIQFVPEERPTKRWRSLGSTQEITVESARNDEDISGEDISAVHHQFLAMGLKKAAIRIEQELGTAASTLDTAAFAGILLPYLRSQISFIKRQADGYPDPEAGCHHGLDEKTASESKWRTLFHSILTEYIRRFVQIEPPKKSPSWARKPVHCGCADCRPLNQFLVSATESVGRFPVGKQRRAHLHSQLEGTGCKHETERRGNPQTLVVTKTQDKYVQMYQAWEQRHNEAVSAIMGLDQELLKQILQNSYQEIVGLKAIRRGGAPASNRLKVRDVNTSGLGKGAGTKRGNEDNPIVL